MALYLLACPGSRAISVTGVTVRGGGSAPAWVRIPGSGKDQVWTQEDDERPARLRHALAANQPAWESTAAGLASQRLGPVLPYLKGAKHVVVLPSLALAGVPIEVLAATIARADGSALVVSYAPSGSLYARLRAARSPAPRPRLRGSAAASSTGGSPDFARATSTRSVSALPRIAQSAATRPTTSQPDACRDDARRPSPVISAASVR